MRYHIRSDLYHIWSDLYHISSPESKTVISPFFSKMTFSYISPILILMHLILTSWNNKTTECVQKVVFEGFTYHFVLGFSASGSINCNKSHIGTIDCNKSCWTYYSLLRQWKNSKNWMMHSFQKKMFQCLKITFKIYFSLIFIKNQNRMQNYSIEVILWQFKMFKCLYLRMNFLDLLQFCFPGTI